MSSAILYVAIVAIWACVLIPRMLHRGSATVVTESAEHSSERVDPSPQHSPSLDAEAEEAGEWAAPQEREPEYDEEPGEPVSPGERRPRGSRPREPLSREESRRRMLAARRRLLLMLLALEAAGVALTVLRLAALWVLIPPTIMLAGYVLLLREASRADAERAASAREAEAEAARDRSRTAADARARERRAAPATTAPAPTGAPAAAAPEPPPAPAPEDYSDLGHGRDYAPGLAGKYTASNSDVIDISEYRRAVGD